MSLRALWNERDDLFVSKRLCVYAIFVEVCDMRLCLCVYICACVRMYLYEYVRV